MAKEFKTIEQLTSNPNTEQHLNGNGHVHKPNDAASAVNKTGKDQKETTGNGLTMQSRN